jgi:hemerythrin-like domain-containing protein
MTTPEFVTLGFDFCRQLESHHSIEDLYVFPLLSRRMPEFQKEEHLPEQHKEIHLGLDQIRAYLNSWTSGDQELNLTQMKEIMDGFSEVLWAHLDEEVKALGAETMRKHWTVQEIDEMMMM